MAQLKAAELRITAAKKQIPFCHLPGSECLTSQPQHHFNTVLLLSQLSLHLHGKVDSTSSTVSGTICSISGHACFQARCQFP